MHTCYKVDCHYDNSRELAEGKYGYASKNLGFFETTTILYDEVHE